MVEKTAEHKKNPLSITPERPKVSPEQPLNLKDVLSSIPKLPTNELRVHSFSSNKNVREAAFEEWLNRKNSEMNEVLELADAERKKASSLRAIPPKFSKSEPAIEKAIQESRKGAVDMEARARQIQAEMEEHKSRVEAIKNIPSSYDPATPLTVSNIPQIFWDRGGKFNHVQTVLDSTRINLKDVINQLEQHEEISVDEAIERAIRFGKPPYHR